MSDISQWSPESGSEHNNAPPPNGAPEGMAPSGVNDVMREIMAAVRRQWQQAEWFEYGHEITRTSGTSFNIVGDQTAIYTVGRRVRVRGVATGTRLGTVTNSQYSVVTSVTITPDSGTIANEPITVEVGVNDPSQASISSQSIADLQTILNAINAKFNALNASNLTTGTVPRARLPAATTGSVGGVQLNNTTNSTSTAQAATANAVRLAATMGSNRIRAMSSRNASTTYTAATDGFFTVTFSGTWNSGPAEILINGTVRARGRDTDGGAITSGQLLFPVAQGQTYRVNNAAGSVSNILWIPIS